MRYIAKDKDEPYRNITLLSWVILSKQ